MSELEKLEEELYGSDEEQLRKRIQSRVWLPASERNLPTSWERTPRETQARRPRKFGKFLLAGGILLAIAAVATFIFLYLGTRGREAEVVIEGRDQVEAGEVVSIPIVLRNISKTALTDAELAIILPSGSKIVESGLERASPPRFSRTIPDLEAGEEYGVEIQARLFGHENEDKVVEAVLLYRPSNLSAQFSSSSNKSLRISRVPLAISWEVPETLSRGQNVEMKVHYISTARVSFDDLSLRMEYPSGFSFESADPAPTVGEGLWHVGVLSPNQEGFITIRGSIVGEEGDIKAFRGAIGFFDTLTKEWSPFAESSRDVKIAVTPLSVQGFLAGSRERLVTPGERLDFVLRYKNNTEVTLKNVSIRAMLDSFPQASESAGAAGILDFSTLRMQRGGVFDTANHAMVWSPAGVGELSLLEPGQGGEVSFSISTRPQPAVRSAEDRHVVVRFKASIDAAGIPQEFSGTQIASSDQIIFKVKSKVLFIAKTLYRSSPIPNSGPLPPQVGQRTTYALVWEVRNFTNDLKNVEVRGKLPPNVKWENVKAPVDVRITYDAGSGDVRWIVGEVKAGTGILQPALAAAFQVSFTPAESDRGSAISLLQDSRLTGTDSFTGEEFEIPVPSLSTELPEDSGADISEWRVE